MSVLLWGVLLLFLIVSATLAFSGRSEPDAGDNEDEKQQRTAW